MTELGIQILTESEWELVELLVFEILHFPSPRFCNLRPAFLDGTWASGLELCESAFLVMVTYRVRGLFLWDWPF